MAIEFTGERYLPEIGGGIELEHTHRYLLASSLAQGKLVLDIASGEGYGSNILARHADRVFGFDISPEAVAHARRHYQSPNLEFNVGDCTAIPLADASVDLIVSFETIEHHDKHEQMLEEFSRVLKPEGVLLISSPDRTEYSDVPGYDNPYHVKELTTDEFSVLVSQYFSSVRLYGQKVEFGSIIGPIGSTPTTMRSFEAAEAGCVESQGVSRPVYILALATNSPAGLSVSIDAGVYSSPAIQQNAEIRDHLAAQVIRLETAVKDIGAEREALRRKAHDQIQALMNSRSWKVTRPLRALAQLFKAVVHDREQLKPVLGRVARRIYATPYLPESAKRLAKSFLLTIFSPFLRNSGIYHRWKIERALAGGGPDSGAPIGNRILVVDRRYPQVDKDSGSITTFSLIRAVRNLGYDVTFMPQDLVDIPQYRARLESEGVECLHSGNVVDLPAYLSEHGRQFNLVILFRAHVAASYLPAIRHFCPRAKIVFHTMDLHFVREERHAELEESEELSRDAANTRNFELDLIRRSDLAVVVSHYERELLTNNHGIDNVAYLPVSFIDVPGATKPFSARSGITFVGGYEHQPNVDAVVYFCEAIWPLVLESIPAAQFRIVGSNPNKAVKQLGELPGVTVVGWVEDISEELSSARMTVAPLRFGAGVKGKVVHSLASGVPCVASPIAVEGMGLASGKHALLADSPEDFAAEVVRLYDDESLWTALSNAGVSFCRKNFSYAIGEGKVAAMLFGLDLPASENDDFVWWQADSFAEYESKIREDEQAILMRREVDAAALSRDYSSGTTLPGYCRVCERSSGFHVDMQYALVSPDGDHLPNLRERLVCTECQLNNRMRLSLDAFALCAQPKSDARVYVTEQVTPLFSTLRSRIPGLIGSEFLGAELPYGECDDRGVRNETLSELTFPDKSLDFILSFDVIEHIPDYYSALRECCRVLDDDGGLLISVPFYLASKVNKLRARLGSDGQIEHLAEPEYHGDPLNDEGVLSFHDFGWELLDDLRAVGFVDVQVNFFWSRKFAYIGADQFFIFARKPKGSLAGVK